MKEMDVELAALSIWSFKHGMTSLAIRNRFHMYTEAQVKRMMKESCDMMLTYSGRSKKFLSVLNTVHKIINV
jgi:hypothetical protein